MLRLIDSNCLEFWSGFHVLLGNTDRKNRNWKRKTQKRAIEKNEKTIRPKASYTWIREIYCPIRFTSMSVSKASSKKKGKLRANDMKHVATGAHLPTPWLFEPAKRPNDRTDHCLDSSFLPKWKHWVLVFTLEWSGARPMGEHCWGLGPMSIPSELGHLAMPTNFLA